MKITGFHFKIVGVCKDTNVIYQSILEKETYESQIWSMCIIKDATSQTPLVSMTTRLILEGPCLWQMPFCVPLFWTWDDSASG